MKERHFSVQDVRDPITQCNLISIFGDSPQAYYGDRWVLMSGNQRGIQSQTLQRQAGDFPLDKVQKLFDDGKRVIKVVLIAGSHRFNNKINFGGADEKTWQILAERVAYDAPEVPFLFMSTKFYRLTLFAGWESEFDYP